MLILCVWCVRWMGERFLRRLPVWVERTLCDSLSFVVWLCIVFSFDVVHEQLIYSPDNCVVYMEKWALLCFAHRRHIYTEFIWKEIRVHHMAAYKFDDRVLYPCNPSNSVPTASQHIYAYTGIVNGMRSRTLSSWRVAEVTRHIR